MTEPQLLNRAALDQLEKDTSPEIVPMILNKFLQELETRCAAIRESLAAGDVERLGLEAHSIKSASRTFGLEQLSVRALTLEDAVRGADAGAVGGLAEQLLGAAESGAAALRTFLGEGT